MIKNVLLKTREFIVVTSVYLSNKCFTRFIWHQLAVHLDSTSVTCSLKLKCASTTITKSFAECDGRISLPSKVMLKSFGMHANICEVPSNSGLVLSGLIRGLCVQQQAAISCSCSLVGLLDRKRQVELRVVDIALQNPLDVKQGRSQYRPMRTHGNLTIHFQFSQTYLYLSKNNLNHYTASRKPFSERSFFSRSPCSKLSNAFDKSSSCNLLSIHSVKDQICHKRGVAYSKASISNEPFFRLTLQ